MITEWIEPNEKWLGASHIKNLDFPQLFPWINSTKIWTSRTKLKIRPFPSTVIHQSLSQSEEYDFYEKGEKIVGRIYTASPREGECYFLRALFPHYTGAKRFADMSAVSGVVCATYREAYQKLGLLTEAAGWKTELFDGFESSFQPLSEFFSLTTFLCPPADTKTLFFDHKDSFIADLWNRFWNHPKLENEELVLQNIYAEFQ